MSYLRFTWPVRNLIRISGQLCLTVKPMFSAMPPLSEIWEHNTERLNESFKREAPLDGFGDSLNSLHAQSIYNSRRQNKQKIRLGVCDIWNPEN